MKKVTNESNKEAKNNEVIGARADTAEVKKYKSKMNDKAIDPNETKEAKPAKNDKT